MFCVLDVIALKKRKLKGVRYSNAIESRDEGKSIEKGRV